MARKRSSPAKKKAAKAQPELVYEEGFWWIVSGTKRLNAGRSKRYAEDMLAERKS
jgi:hypothetical protein